MPYSLSITPEGRRRITLNKYYNKLNNIGHTQYSDSQTNITLFQGKFFITCVFIERFGQAMNAILNYYI